jgi:hypothetical protein
MNNEGLRRTMKNPVVRTNCVLAEIQAKHLLNLILGSYYYTNQLSPWKY